MSRPTANSSETILFVTGRLAEPGLREVIAGIAEKLGFRYEIAVPGIQVAALLHVSLLIKRLTVPQHISRVILPGWCQGDLSELEQHFGKPFEPGPREMFSRIPLALLPSGTIAVLRRWYDELRVMVISLRGWKPRFARMPPVLLLPTRSTPFSFSKLPETP